MKIEMVVNEEAKASYPIKAARDKEWVWHLENPGSVANEYIASKVATAFRAAVAEAVAGERELLEYVYQQTLGDLLGSHVKDDEMVRVFLSAGMLRRIAAARVRSRGAGEGEEVVKPGRENTDSPR